MNARLDTLTRRLMVPANEQEVTNMSVDVVLDQPIGSARSIRLGPFASVRVAHRRISAGRTQIVRHFDGTWHVGDARYFEARLEPSGAAGKRLVEVKFTQPWAGRSPSVQAPAVRLYGERLLDGGRWIASDDDGARCWVAEDTGRASTGLLITAA